MRLKSKFTDLFIQRPVLASVISLFILLLGLRAIFVIPIQQYPTMKNTDITVSTLYPGASPEVVQGFITTLLSRSISAAEGIDYLSASSEKGQSTITAHIHLNYDPDKALVNVQTKVLAVADQLPRESQQPVILKKTGNQVALMYIAYTSNKMTQSQIADYLGKVVLPAIQTIPGVGETSVLGATEPAIRVWLEPQKLAAYQLNISDVTNALQANNYQSAAGLVSSKYVRLSIDAQTAASDIDQFSNIVIKRQADASLLRIRDVAKVEMGAENYNSSVVVNGKNAVFVAVNVAPDANPLEVITKVKAQLPALAKNYPSMLQGKVVYDVTNYIRSSIHEVLITIGEASLIVIVIMFLFLGSLRAVIIPMVTIPLSLIGVCTLMLALGFSLNLLTLLAMVLAIGLVVDDAIVVVENIYRHIEQGMNNLQAALQGAREIAIPVVTMSITLAAVYLPIVVMRGLTAALFTEFAITLALSVIISGIVALTLSPMMCSKILTHDVAEATFAKLVTTFFLRLKNVYHRWLVAVLSERLVVLVFAILILLSCVILALTTRKELAPQEDQGLVVVGINAPHYADLNYVMTYSKQLEKIYATIPDIENYFVINELNSGFSCAILKPWSERILSQKAIVTAINDKLKFNTGLAMDTYPLPPLPGSYGPPVQFVLTTLTSYQLLTEATNTLLKDANESGMFIFAMTDLIFNQPTLTLAIDRNKAADLGVTMQDISNTLGLSLGEVYVNRFNQQQNTYKVVPQLAYSYRQNPEDVGNIYVRSQRNVMVPLASLISFKINPDLPVLNQYQQLNSATISAAMKPGFSITDGLNFLAHDLAAKYPKKFGVGYTGESRQLMQQGNQLPFTFAFAIIIIFLVLAAQFESFRDPLIILISVPMSICGALIFLNVGIASLNIYTSIGLVTLIGLISKHGILIVDFANKLRDRDKVSIYDAITTAAALRLRPILMTTMAIVFGVLPLLLSNGPGAASRFSIGIVIFSGMLIGTCFTLFVVPVMYTYLTSPKRNTSA